MGFYGLVNGQWQFFPSIIAAQQAGAVDIKEAPAGTPTPPSGWTPPDSQQIAPFPPGGPPPGWKPPTPSTQPYKPTQWAGPNATYPNWDDPAGPFANDVAIMGPPPFWDQPDTSWNPIHSPEQGGPPSPNHYWDEVSGQWRLPQPDGSTPGAMPSIGPGPPQFWPPGGPPQWQPPGDIAQPYPDEPILDYPPPSEPAKGNPFEEYVKNYPDLTEAYKKHKSKGGKGDAASWGKLHFERHGQKEKRKVPGLSSSVINGKPKPGPTVPQPGPPTTSTTPDWGKYLSRNPDLQKAFGTDVGKAQQHWKQFGSKEKRQFNPFN